MKARLLGLPLVTLFGAVRDSVPVYGRGGFTSYDLRALVDQLGGWVASGIRMVKMKVGRDAAADRQRVRAVWQAIGPEASLFVDANGAYLHVCCALRPVVHVEYFHDHVRIEQMLFEGAAVPRDGNLHPDLSRPGLDLTLKRKDAERHAL